jgi:hypothetical protein
MQERAGKAPSKQGKGRDEGKTTIFLAHLSEK